MFQLSNYNVVQSPNDEIYVDLDNVYIPSIIMDNPSLVSTFEKFWMQDFDSRITALIRIYWIEELKKLPDIINTKHGKYLFDRLIRKDIPSHVLQDYSVRRTENYCFVKEIYSVNFEYYGVYDPKTHMYTPILNHALRSKITTGLNRETPEWNMVDFMSVITLLKQHYSYPRWEGMSTMGESKQYVNIYELVCVGSDINGNIQYTFSIPQIDFFPKRIKCNGLTIHNGVENHESYPCGAKLDKGIWKTTRDKGNMIERSPEYYYNKLISFCENPVTDRLMHTILDVHRISNDLYCVSNKGSNLLDSSLIINPRKRHPLVVAGICEGKVYGIAGADISGVEHAERFLLSLKLQA